MTGGGATVHIVGMTTEISPADRIISETHHREISCGSRFTFPDGFSYGISFRWTITEGAPQSDAHFAASLTYYNSGNPIGRSFHGKRGQTQSVPDHVVGYGEKLLGVWDGTDTDTALKVHRARHIQRDLDVSQLTLSTGEPLPPDISLASICWKCDEDGDRSLDRFSLCLKPIGGDFHPQGPIWDGDGDVAESRWHPIGLRAGSLVAGDGQPMPDGLVQLVEECRADLLAWVPAQT